MRQRIIKINLKMILVVIALVAVVGLPGCAKKPKSVYIPPEKKPTVEESRAYYIAELEKNGAQVIQVGEEIRVILRDDTTFIPDSANVRKEARPVLDWTAQLIKTYSKVDVKISGYLDNQGRGTYLAALSTRQAQVIANYLWDKGIDTRLLYAVGYNRLNPVDWNGTALGRSFNRRVEVSFRYYPHYESYE